MYGTLLFDFDGTIGNSLPSVGGAFLETLKRYGFEDLTLEDMRKCIGPPLHYSFSQFFSLGEKECEEAIATYREYHARFAHLDKPFDGMEDALRTLRDRGFRLAVATTKRESSAVGLLDRFGLLPLFDLVAGEAEGRRSEKSEVVRCALSALGSAPDEALMIGDRLYDVEGAAAAGVKTLGVLWGFGSREELLSAGAVATVATPAELVDYLTRGL